MPHPPQELIRRLERVLTPKEMKAWLEGWQQSLAAGEEPPPIPTWGLPSPSPNRNL
ncbi:hypothetical protein PMIT1342_00299 [Prochlorococcus marinus str. MIT 1342]|nr:hypothetical protein PMIT1342_00299 [Prochlorococcus marinus str. MIT 1342]